MEESLLHLAGTLDCIYFEDYAEGSWGRQKEDTGGIKDGFVKLIKTGLVEMLYVGDTRYELPFFIDYGIKWQNETRLFLSVSSPHQFAIFIKLFAAWNDPCCRVNHWSSWAPIILNVLLLHFLVFFIDRNARQVAPIPNSFPRPSHTYIPRHLGNRPSAETHPALPRWWA